MTGLRKRGGAAYVCVALMLGSVGCYSRVNNGQGLEPSFAIMVTNTSTDAIRVYLGDEGSYRSLLGVVEAGQTRHLRLSASEGQGSGTLRRLIVAKSAGDVAASGATFAANSAVLTTELLAPTRLTRVAWTVRDNSISALPPRAWSQR